MCTHDISSGNGKYNWFMKMKKQKPIRGRQSGIYNCETSGKCISSLFGLNK